MDEGRCVHPYLDFFYLLGVLDVEELPSCYL